MSHVMAILCCGRSVAEIREENILLRNSALQYKRAASEAYRDGVSAIARLTKELACQHQISTSLGCALDKARREIASLGELAQKDPLTGLLNRRGLTEHLAGIASAFSHARKEGEGSNHHHQSLECSFVYIDLDKFKPINDAYGHDKGDEVLRAFADLLRQTFARHADLVARMGGDEFMIIMTNSDIKGATKQSQMILDRMKEDETFHLRAADGSSEYHHVSASIGIASMVLQSQPGALSVETIESHLAEATRRADAAMFEVKETGRNGVAIARANDE